MDEWMDICHHLKYEMISSTLKTEEKHESVSPKRGWSERHGLSGTIPRNVFESGTIHLKCNPCYMNKWTTASERHCHTKTRSPVLRTKDL